MDKFAALQCFVKVVESGSFVKAAEALELPSSAVSRAITGLEHELGAQLIYRTTRRLTITEPGQIYYEKCAEVLRDLAAADASLADGAAPSGTLKVGCHRAFGLRGLTHLIKRYRACYPDVQLNIVTGLSPSDMVSEGVDVYISLFGKLPDRMISTRLGPIPIITCAAPAYLEHFGVPQNPADLANHTVLTSPTGHYARSWQFLGPSEVVNEVMLRDRIGVNDLEVMRSIGLAGEAILRLPRYMILDDLEKGLLIPILDEFFTYPAVDAHILYHPTPRPSATVRSFVDCTRDFWKDRRDFYMPARNDSISAASTGSGKGLH